MTFEDTFKRVLAKYMRQKVNLPVAKVLSYEQEKYEGGYCDTCYYTEIRVEVVYQDTSDREDYWTYYGSMVELIESLAAVDDVDGDSVPVP